MKWKSIAFDFAGATVLVVGGSGGIGGAIARGFRDAGADLTVTGTKPSAKDYSDDLGRMRYRQLDVRDGATIERFASDSDTLDVLVNAGGRIDPRGEFEPKGFADAVDINLVGTYRACHAFRKQLRAAKGCIVNIASLTSFGTLPSVPGYGAAKAGIVQLTMTLAATMGKHGVRANAIAPGWTRTKMTVGTQEDATLAAAVVARTPLGRWGEPSDIVGAAMFLASDAAAHITGVTVPIDGGFIGVL